MTDAPLSLILAVGIPVFCVILWFMLRLFGPRRD
jgi:hypothetical protein